MASAGSATIQDEVNRKVYFAPSVFRHYLSEALTPAEATCLLKYQPAFAQKTLLDVGVGAGRTTRVLLPLVARYEAIDYSPVMVEYMKRTQPAASVRQADWRSLDAFAGAAFDFIFATDNVIDALAHEDRLQALHESHRVLRPGGILAFSAHNLNFHAALSGPKLQWSNNPVHLAANTLQFAKRLRNHWRVSKLRKVTADYALLNDEGHDYACLHYYATRASVHAQLAAAGFNLLDAIDWRGRSLPPGADDSASPSLLYVAQRD